MAAGSAGVVSAVAVPGALLQDSAAQAVGGAGVHWSFRGPLNCSVGRGLDGAVTLIGCRGDGFVSGVGPRPCYTHKLWEGQAAASDVENPQTTKTRVPLPASETMTINKDKHV